MVQFDQDGSGSLNLHEFVTMIAKSESFKFKISEHEKMELLDAVSNRTAGARINAALQGKIVRDDTAHTQCVDSILASRTIKAAVDGIEIRKLFRSRHHDAPEGT